MLQWRSHSKAKCTGVFVLLGQQGLPMAIIVWNSGNKDFFQTKGDQLLVTEDNFYICMFVCKYIT